MIHSVQSICISRLLPSMDFIFLLFLYFIVTEIIRKMREAVCNTTRESMRVEDTFDYDNLQNENIFQGNTDR